MYPCCDPGCHGGGRYGNGNEARQASSPTGSSASRRTLPRPASARDPAEAGVSNSRHWIATAQVLQRGVSARRNGRQEMKSVNCEALTLADPERGSCCHRPGETSRVLALTRSSGWPVQGGILSDARILVGGLAPARGGPSGPAPVSGCHVRGADSVRAEVCDPGYTGWAIRELGGHREP